jgi:hypothetical protein
MGGSIVNAAFLLVTTAWLTGADPAPTAAPAAPAPVVSSANYGGAGCGCSGGCGDTCGDTGCGCGGLFGKLKGRFHHGGDCGCETACDSCGGHHGFKLRRHNECGCETANECGCERQRLCDRLKGWFHRRGECGCGEGCGGGCGGCGDGSCANGGVTTYAAPGLAPRAEPIPAPKGTEPAKRMPSDTPMKKVGALAPQASPTLVIEQ